MSDVASEADDLPDFLKNMTIPIEDLSVQLNCTKGTKESEYVDFSIETKVGPNFHLIFIQLQKPESGGLNDWIQRYMTKPVRLIRVVLIRLPNALDIPMLGKYGQPFDQVSFTWMNSSFGWNDMDALNTEVFKPDEQLRCEDGKVQADSEDKVLGVGYHFQIALKEGDRSNVVLDHVFSTPRPKKNPTQAVRNQCHLLNQNRARVNLLAPLRRDPGSGKELKPGGGEENQSKSYHQCQNPRFYAEHHHWRSDQLRSSFCKNDWLLLGYRPVQSKDVAGLSNFAAFSLTVRHRTRVFKATNSPRRADKETTRWTCRRSLHNVLEMGIHGSRLVSKITEGRIDLPNHICVCEAGRSSD